MAIIAQDVPSPAEALASDFRDALRDGTDLRIYAVHERAVLDAELYCEAALLLDSGERRLLKESIARVRKEKREDAPMLPNGRAAIVR